MLCSISNVRAVGPDEQAQKPEGMILDGLTCPNTHVGARIPAEAMFCIRARCSVQLQIRVRRFV